MRSTSLRLAVDISNVAVGVGGPGGFMPVGLTNFGGVAPVDDAILTDRPGMVPASDGDDGDSVGVVVLDACCGEHLMQVVQGVSIAGHGSSGW